MSSKISAGAEKIQAIIVSFRCREDTFSFIIFTSYKMIRGTGLCPFPDIPDA
jgi:hypothetical protein